MNINISDIAKGMPGITPAVGAVLVENCTVMLHEVGHKAPTPIAIYGMLEQTSQILWEDNYTEQMARAHADMQETTELAAACVSLAVTQQITGYTVIERSRKGTGFDYLLGEDAEWFLPKARLEVSGIAKETLTNTIEGRFRQKSAQTSVSDNTNLPAYISIVEFSSPKVLFNKK